MNYFICGYCGNSGKSLFKRVLLFWPRCKCPGGNGKTLMDRASKQGFKSNNKNQKETKRLNK